MSERQDALKQLRIAAPCQAMWESMAGDERVRHCTLCNLNVYNFSEMTDDEVRTLLAQSEGKVCARLFRRADGTIITRDCPSGLRALTRRLSGAVAAVVAALFNFTACTSGDRFFERKHGSTIKLEIEQVAKSQNATFKGLVGDANNNPLPGVSVALTDEITHRTDTTVTDINGAFMLAFRNDGIYRVEVTLPGLNPLVMKHVALKRGEVTHARVAMRFESTTTIIVGAIAGDPLSTDGISTTFSQDLIDKLPIGNRR